MIKAFLVYSLCLIIGFSNAEVIDFSNGKIKNVDKIDLELKKFESKTHYPLKFVVFDTLSFERTKEVVNYYQFSKDCIVYMIVLSNGFESLFLGSSIKVNDRLKDDDFTFLVFKSPILYAYMDDNKVDSIMFADKNRLENSFKNCDYLMHSNQIQKFDLMDRLSSIKSFVQINNIRFDDDENLNSEEKIDSKRFMFQFVVAVLFVILLLSFTSRLNGIKSFIIRNLLGLICIILFGMWQMELYFIPVVLFIVPFFILINKKDLN